MNQFGTLLRFYREQCVDQDSARGRLTQARLGELLGEALGIADGYTGAAVSEWERNRSQIHKDQRPVLLAIIQILYQQGGLQTPAEADRLLQTGNYRSLSRDERRQIFAETERVDIEDPAPQRHESGQLWRLMVILMTELTYNPVDTFRRLRNDIAQGPPPHWPRFILAVLGWPFNRWSSDDLLKMILWIGLWLLTYRFIMPSLSWPFADHAAAQSAMLLYVTGALTLPLFVGALTVTKRELFWQRANLKSPGMLRLYTHQGALVGFHVAYGLLVATAFGAYFLGLWPVSGWLRGVAAGGLLLVSYAAARQTPLNLWRAYGDLRWRDGRIFFVFIFFGPLWGAFFLHYYPLLLAPFGLFVLLLAIGLAAASISWQRRQSGKP